MCLQLGQEVHLVVDIEIAYDTFHIPTVVHIFEQTHRINRAVGHTARTYSLPIASEDGLA